MPNLQNIYEHIATMGSKREFEYAIFAGLFFLVFFFATLHLSESPAIWYDEGFYTQLALNASHGDGFRIQIAPRSFVSGSGITVGYPLTAPVALSYHIFGPSVLAGRAVMVVFILALLIVVYLFVRKLFGVPAAMLSGLLLATFPVLYGDGKSVLGEVPGMFFVTLTFYMMLVLERHSWRGAWRFALLGLCAGLAVVTKPIYILLLPAGLVGLLWRGRTLFLRPAGIVTAVGAFLIVFGVWVATQFTTADTLNAILTFYLNPYNAGHVAQLMLTNLARFITETNPIYLLVLLAIWWGSMFLRRAHLTATECTAAALAFLVLFFYLRTPGWYRYFFPAQVLAIVFAPAALLWLAEKIRERISNTTLAPFRWFPVIVVACVFALLSAAQLYQLGFSSYVASYYSSTRTASLRAYFATLPKTMNIFAYNVPETVVFFGGRAYYQYIAPHPDQLFGVEELPLLTAGTADIVIMNRAAYQENPNPFSAYSFQKVVGYHYVILTRKTTLIRHTGL